MSSRAALMRRLSILPTEGLLKLLKDETLIELAMKFFDSETRQVKQDTEVENLDDVRKASQAHISMGGEKLKRPLNAFMAFRSYYLKLFPEAQQKTASGFLTTLWGQEPCRNKWALIAKVYSFVRDEVGKRKVTLAYFLSLSCPLMEIIPPMEYLQALGWYVVEDETHSQKLIHHHPNQHLQLPNLTSKAHPSTEMELLTALIDIGYLPDDGYILINRMGNHRSGVMTTTTLRGDLPVPYTREKLDMLNAIRANPATVAKELLGDKHYLAISADHSNVKVYNVENMAYINHITMQSPIQNSHQYFDPGVGRNAELPTHATTLSITTLPEYRYFDIHNPWDMDAVMKQMQVGNGVDDHHLTQTLMYEPQDDFNFLF